MNFKTMKSKLLGISLSIALVLPIIPLPGAFAASLNVTAYGASGSDGADDKTAFQNAINAAVSGDTVYIPAGTYHLSGAVTGKTGVKIKGENRDTTIIKSTSTGQERMFSFYNLSNVEISDLTLDGNSNNSVLSAVVSEGGSNNKMSQLRVKDFTASAGFGPFALYAIGSPNIEISDNIITNIGVNSAWGGAVRAGWGSNYAKILNNTIHDTGRGGIFANDGCLYVEVRGNNITGTGHHTEGLGIELHTDCDYSLIEDNHVDHWISAVRSKYIAVRNNVVKATDGSVGYMGLEVMVEHGVTTGNLVDGGQQVGMQQSPGTGYQYWGYNTIQNMVMWGMQLQGEGTGQTEQYQYFYKNTFKDGPRDNPQAAYAGYGGNAIRIHGNSQNLTFDSNQIINNGRKGIEITTASGVDRLSFINNTITGNTGESIDQYPSSAANLEWSGNIVSGNGTNTQLTSRGFSNPKPVANFTAPVTVQLGSPITFTNTSTDNGSISENLWDFGEGVPSTTVSPSYTYQKAGTYRVTLVVWDNEGRASLKEQTVNVNAGPPDTTAPSAPASLASPSKTDVSVNLTWSASTDNIGVYGYEVYRNGTLIGTTTGVGSTAYTAAGLTPSTAYSFTVKAKDAAGNLSAASNTLNITTNAPDTTAPSVPANLASPSHTDVSVSLTWSQSTDNLGVTGYEIYRGGVLAGTTTGVGSTSLTVTGLTPSTAYSFTVKAKDAAGNLSAASSALSVTTNAPAVNTYISDLTWSSATTGWGNVQKDKSNESRTITLNGVTYAKGIGTHANSEITYNLNGNYYRFQSDIGVDDEVLAVNNGTVTFEVWLDGVKAYDSGIMNASTATKSIDLDVTGVSVLKLVVGDAGDGTGYDHADWANARLSSASGGNPNPGDTTAPSTPANLASPSKTATSVNLTWGTSTDNVAVTGYNVYNGSTLAGTTTGASATSVTISGLTASTAYTFTVRAKDAANNLSAASNALSVTTNAAAGDTTVPSAPANLASPSKTDTSVNLTWSASTDNVGVTGYNVYNGSTLAGTTTGASATSITVTGLAASTAYSFTVKAKDAANNLSAASNALSVTTNASSGGGTGNGLLGQYYAGNFGSLEMERTDATIDFDWGGDRPTVNVPGEWFTVRWTGKVQPQYTETYTFYTHTDDGVRLWINGVQVINQWQSMNGELSATVSLTAGVKYDIKMEFLENGGNAHASLSWSSASQSKQIVPNARLFLN
ncbi:chitodextrinase [Paenibacillus endophyticus]|uniref:Chitodextrinase n=2 Tax=Paenibacillus endophyticus TaxID=1294268 RepID=A0A7W5C578_9BACL|nr:NPCBM/NEW2 domain-containing protein [Paenibacillus endophyticus]MBB3151400.1 chitodextrinase [Paenibacillus endophyticus]